MRMLDRKVRDQIIDTKSDLSDYLNRSVAEITSLFYTYDDFIDYLGEDKYNNLNSKFRDAIKKAFNTKKVEINEKSTSDYILKEIKYQTIVDDPEILIELVKEAHEAYPRITRVECHDIPNDEYREHLIPGKNVTEDLIEVSPEPFFNDKGEVHEQMGTWTNSLVFMKFLGVDYYKKINHGRG